MENHDDKRKHPRVKIVIPIAVASGAEQNLDLADIDDLTVEGVAFLSEKSIPKGSGVYVIFPTGKGVKENEVPGEVLRSQLVTGSNKYRTVVRFIEVNEAFARDALALIQKEVQDAKKHGAK